LERLHAADPFEERPTIWKGVVLKNAGRLEEAEAAIRQAISIDPSDGETHDGRRLYAYTVLAEIREARGDNGQAAEYREAVAAIRLAEKADEMQEAGLTNRAIATYEESLRRFSAAYCIQSRLAIQLMEEGRTKEAEEHYRRAYELMPDSFGRVETHCMGCEGVFKGELAQNVAERTFDRLAKETPNKPQVHYLLGYLRESQGRYEEAMASYSRAVELDPDYLNAWIKLSGLSEYLTIVPERQRAIASAILRLDPLQKHGSDDGVLEGAALAEVWKATEAAITAQMPTGPRAIYPLAASAEALEKQKASASEAFSRGAYIREVTGPIASGGAALSRVPVVRHLIRLYDSEADPEMIKD
ncbi:tetratricopeptide repeat protein, partial [bacterium]